MCGRFTLTIDAAKLQTAFALESVPAEVVPRYNVAPTQQIAVITNEHPRDAAMLRWGLVPHWADDLSIGSRMINARAETVAEKPAFREAFKRRRCLIPTTGFYEWTAEGKVKTPNFIHLTDKDVFAFAGLWENWKNADGDWVQTCTIITTDAAPQLQRIHNRMPVVLDTGDYDAWLHADDADVLKGLLRPYTTDTWQTYPVSRAVNKPDNDTPDLVRPT